AVADEFHARGSWLSHVVRLLKTLTGSSSSVGQWSKSWQLRRLPALSLIRSCWSLLEPRAGWLLQTIARLVTGPAGAARKAILISMTTIGLGAASSPTSNRRSATAREPATTRDARGLCRRLAATIS